MKRKNNNTVYTKKSDLDQFYTAEHIAKTCYEKVLELYPDKEFSLFFEPSAGTGAFYNLFPTKKRLGIDLDPKCDGVEKQDFFEFVAPENEKIATIGNPPFGKNASLAIKFFNKAAEFSEVIAFIIPKTFQKKSVHNRLSLDFRLVWDENLPKDSFVLDGEPYNVPCCFQIWERSPSKRRISKVNLDNDFFSFVKKDEADLAVRRVGGRTGKANKDIATCAEVSHYFLKIKGNRSVDRLIDQINDIDFSKVINATAGVKSLSKPEFVSRFLRSTK